MATKSPDYDVALSFAGEDREYVLEVATYLKDNGIRVFYDEFETVGLWGRDLYSHLDTVYRKSARFCVMFISALYAEKVWTNHERRSAQARAMSENAEYLLPCRFDDTEIEGLVPTVGVVDLNRVSPSELGEMIIQKLGPRKVEEGFPQHPDNLWNFLEVSEDDIAERRRTEAVARAFFQALGRMNLNERKAVCGVLAFGCSGELPDRVHISLDLLSRMTSRRIEDLIDDLAAVHSLNVKVVTRELQHDPEPGELLSADDRDIVISFWSVFEDDSGDSTAIAYSTIHAASQHFCENHGLDVVVRLDFHELSSAFKGPVIIPDE